MKRTAYIRTLVARSRVAIFASAEVLINENRTSKDMGPERFSLGRVFEKRAGINESAKSMGNTAHIELEMTWERHLET